MSGCRERPPDTAFFRLFGARPRHPDYPRKPCVFGQLVVEKEVRERFEGRIERVAAEVVDPFGP